MTLRCDKHRVLLRRKRVRGKLTWECPYSHARRHSDPPAGPTCQRGDGRPVYTESLCYPCWYYR